MTINSLYHIHDIVERDDISTEDLIKYSIKVGFKKLYFTEHFPLPIQYKDRPSIQVITKFKKELVSLVSSKYKGQIQVYFGTEMEYPKTNLKYFKDVVNSKIFDFVIFGNHFFVSDAYNLKAERGWKETIDEHASSKGKPITKHNLDIFYKDAARALKSGIFSLMAHPDAWLWKWDKWDDEAIALTRKLIALCKKYDMPIGFNSKRFNNKEITKPIKNFWKLVSKSDLKVVIESDAHKFKDYKIENIEYAYDLAVKLGLEKNIVNDIKVKFFQK